MAAELEKSPLSRAASLLLPGIKPWLPELSIRVFILHNNRPGQGQAESAGPPSNNKAKVKVQ